MLEVLYPILLAVAVADAVMCLVGWLDKPQENEKRRSRSGAREQRRRVS